MEHQILHAVSAALLTNDLRPVAETSSWIAEPMQTRGVDLTRVRELRELLVDVLTGYSRSRELIERHFAGEQA